MKLKKPVIHLICNAHLDPVWQWRWEEGCAEALSTFRTAVKIIKSSDDFIFNHNESVLYEWVKEYDSKLFKQIQKQVEKGKWHISGGWFLQPDLNVPQTESIIRQIAYGRDFFSRHFKSKPEVAYNFDSFGHPAGLPQILRKSGYKMYIHMRPEKEHLELPSDLYRWIGADGSSILAYRIAIGLYHTEYDNLKQRLDEAAELALELERDVPLFWGIGDHGGGASMDDLKTINEYKKDRGDVKIIHSTPEKFYKAVKDLKDIPVFEESLQRVFTGCYTSLSRIKRRAAENLSQLVQTEIASAAAYWLKKAPYPAEQLEKAWKQHLFNDFHDILPGTCIEPAERDALDLYGASSQAVREINLKNAVAFGSGKQKDLYIPVTVINNNTALQKIPVEAEFMIDHRPKWEGEWHVKLTNINGKSIQAQEEQPEALLPFNGWRRKISFLAKLPFAGAAHYEIKAVEGREPELDSKLQLRFDVNESTGLVHKLYDDIDKGFQLLKGEMIQPIVYNDTGDSWGTGMKKCDKETGRFETDPDSINIIESGPVRTIRESIMHYGSSKIVFHTIAYGDLPVIEYKIRIHWNEERRRLKFSVPTVFTDSHPYCEIPGGAFNIRSDGEEHVHGRWCIIGDKDCAIGIASYGMHSVSSSNGRMDFSVLRSPLYCHEQGFKTGKYPYRKASDQGVHDVRILVTQGRFEKLTRSINGWADYISAPPAVFTHLPYGSAVSKKEKGKAEAVKEFISVKPANVQLAAVMKARSKNALIVRLRETQGIEAKTALKINGLEKKITFKLKPFEIRTLLINRDGKRKKTDLTVL